MTVRFDPSSSALASDAVARALAAVALAALAVIHVIDLPDTIGPLPLIGAGYLAIVAASVAVGAALIAGSHWLAWAAAGGLAAAALGGYLLTRTVSGFLGDHDDVGNWRCPLGIAALSTEALLILLAAWRVRSARAAAPMPRRRTGTQPTREYSHLG